VIFAFEVAVALMVVVFFVFTVTAVLDVIFRLPFLTVILQVAL